MLLKLLVEVNKLLGLLKKGVEGTLMVDVGLVVVVVREEEVEVVNWEKKAGGKKGNVLLGTMLF